MADLEPDHALMFRIMSKLDLSAEPIWHKRRYLTNSFVITLAKQIYQKSPTLYRHI